MAACGNFARAGAVHIDDRFGDGRPVRSSRIRTFGHFGCAAGIGLSDLFDPVVSGLQNCSARHQLETEFIRKFAPPIHTASGTGKTANAITATDVGVWNRRLNPAMKEIPPPLPITEFPGMFNKAANRM